MIKSSMVIAYCFYHKAFSVRATSIPIEKSLRLVLLSQSKWLGLFHKTISVPDGSSSFSPSPHLYHLLTYEAGKLLGK